jgi:hypothetical protein
MTFEVVWRTEGRKRCHKVGPFHTREKAIEYADRVRSHRPNAQVWVDEVPKKEAP